jgi:hypothetical protein
MSILSSILAKDENSVTSDDLRRFEVWFIISATVPHKLSVEIAITLVSAIVIFRRNSEVVQHCCEPNEAHPCFVFLISEFIKYIA